MRVLPRTGDSGCVGCVGRAAPEYRGARPCFVLLKRELYNLQHYTIDPGLHIGHGLSINAKPMGKFLDSFYSENTADIRLIL